MVKDPKDLITIYKGANTAEAYLVRNALADEGIEASVAEAVTFSTPFAPSDVLVHRNDEAQARAIIARYDAEQIERAHRPDWTCPECSANVLGALDECDACGADRPGTEED